MAAVSYFINVAHSGGKLPLQHIEHNFTPQVAGIDLEGHRSRRACTPVPDSASSPGNRFGTPTPLEAFFFPQECRCLDSPFEISAQQALNRWKLGIIFDCVDQKGAKHKFLVLMFLGVIGKDNQPPPNVTLSRTLVLVVVLWRE